MPSVVSGQAHLRKDVRADAARVTEAAELPVLWHNPRVLTAFQLAIAPLDGFMVARRTGPGHPRWFQGRWAVMFPTVLDQERFVVRAVSRRDIGRGEIVVYEPEPVIGSRVGTWLVEP